MMYVSSATKMNAERYSKLFADLTTANHKGPEWGLIITEFIKEVIQETNESSSAEQQGSGSSR